MFVTNTKCFLAIRCSIFCMVFYSRKIGYITRFTGRSPAYALRCVDFSMLFVVCIFGMGVLAGFCYLIKKTKCSVLSSVR